MDVGGSQTVSFGACVHVLHLCIPHDMVIARKTTCLDYAQNSSMGGILCVGGTVCRVKMCRTGRYEYIHEFVIRVCELTLYRVHE